MTIDLTYEEIVIILGWSNTELDIHGLADDELELSRKLRKELNHSIILEATKELAP